jgi:hypothetical protein
MRALFMIWLTSLLDACVSHDARVRCDRRLEPINVQQPAERPALQGGRG